MKRVEHYSWPVRLATPEILKMCVGNFIFDRTDPGAKVEVVQPRIPTMGRG